MRPKLVFAHNLPVGGAKRAFHSILPLLAEEFDLSVHEFEEADNQLLDLATGSIRRVLYRPPKLPSKSIQRLPLVGPILRRSQLLKAYRPMADGIRREDSECVMVSHCRHTQSPILIELLPARPVYFCHEPPRGLHEPLPHRPYYPDGGVLRSWCRRMNRHYLRNLDRKLVESARDLIANSMYSAEVLYRVYGRKAVPCQLGVDGAGAFRPRAERRSDYVLSVGSLTPAKAHDFAVECVAALTENRRPLLIIASPSGTQHQEEKRFLEGLAERLRVKLEFRVVVEDEELAMLYSQAIATIYCPHLEPFGLVSLESMACGTPVLGVAEGGVRETILHEKTGFLLPWKPAAFARTLLRLRADRGLLERMGCFGTEWVRQQFTWRRTAESVSDVIGRNFEPGLPRVSDRISWARG